MIVLVWITRVVLYTTLLPTAYPAAFIVSIFTRPGVHDLPSYKWGWIYGTYDNPPQGDEGYVAKRSPFPGVLFGWRGYINRSMWIIRNKLYNLKKRIGVTRSDCTNVTISGNPDINDKYGISGWMTAVGRCHSGKVKSFEFYLVYGYPFWSGRGLRVRLGWKIKGRKFTNPGDFAPLVFTINPFDGYGND